MSRQSPFSNRTCLISRLAICLLLGAVPTAAWSVELSRLVKFDIPAQPLSTALIRFSQQTDLQVVTAGAKVDGVNSQGVTGRYAVGEALAHVLDGTGFVYRSVGDGTVTIVGKEGAAASEAATGANGVTRLAQDDVRSGKSSTRQEGMIQMARNLTDLEEPILRRTRFLIMDRDTKYSETFRAALTRERIEPIRLPPRSPNLNAFAERFVRSVKEECVGRMIFFGRSSLELTEYVAHYHEERNHQGLRNQLLQSAGAVANRRDGRVKRRQRLGGMLNFYHRAVA